MDENEYLQLIEETFEVLDESLDNVEEDIDYQESGGVISVDFPNGTTLVFSRQPPVRQLWLAARSGGFHFVYDPEAGDWRDTRSGELFRPFVVAQMREQGGVDFVWA